MKERNFLIEAVTEVKDAFIEVMAETKDSIIEAADEAKDFFVDAAREVKDFAIRVAPKVKSFFIKTGWCAIAACSFYTVPIAFGGGAAFLGYTTSMIGKGLKALGREDIGNKLQYGGDKLTKIGLAGLLSPFVTINQERIDAVPKLMSGLALGAAGILTVSYYLPIMLPGGIVCAAGGLMVAGVGAALQVVGQKDIGEKVREVGGGIAVAGVAIAAFPALPMATFAEAGYNLIMGEEMAIGEGKDKIPFSVKAAFVAAYHKIGVKSKDIAPERKENVVQSASSKGKDHVSPSHGINFRERSNLSQQRHARIQ